MAYMKRMDGRRSLRRLPRHLRNEDIPVDRFTPRTYEVELLERAARRNTVVCMGSSSGRKFIAAMLMKEMSSDVRKPLEEGGKRTFFLLDTDEQVEDVGGSLQYTSLLKVNFYTNTMGLSGWSQQQWTRQLEQSEALIMTGTTFLQLISQAFVSLDLVNLLILDDCQLVLEEHPYKQIMENYGSASNKPRILGLTPNFLTGKRQNPALLEEYIGSLEKLLYSVAETSSLVISDHHSIRPTERIIECKDYEDTTDLNAQMYEILEHSIDFLEECNITVDEDLDNRSPCLISKAALIECHNILTRLGPWCAACIADMLIAQIEKIEKQKEFIPLHKTFLKLGATCLRRVSKVFEEHFKHCEYSLEHLLAYSTPKVAELLGCLHKYRPETDFVIVSEDINFDSESMEGDDEDDDDDGLSDDDSEFSDEDSGSEIDMRASSAKQVHIAIKKPSEDNNDEGNDNPFQPEDKCLCGIVFVEHQHEAFALNKFIEEACAWDEGLCFVRSSHLTGNKSTTKKTNLFKKQEETLKKFRMQEYNLLVSTSILEDGVDVPKCNLVIRFDVPRSYKSYSQSKGRARASEAEFVILVEEENADQLEAELGTYHSIEKVLLCRDQSMSNQKAEESPPSVVCDPLTFTPAGDNSVKVTMDRAIVLVNRYCAKLPSDAFTHLTPSCTIGEVTSGEQTLYTASVRLPINSPIKDLIQGPAMLTPLLAKQAVAVQICQTLYENGELDDQLLPVGKEMFEGEEEELWDEEETDVQGEARPGTTKRKQYYCKQVATALQHSEPRCDSQCFLYVISMQLTGPITDDQNTRGRKLYAPEESSRCFGILTCNSIPLVPTFPVFTRSGEVTVSIDLLSSSVCLTSAQLDQLKIFHQFVFSSVLRLEKDPLDFIPDQSKVGCLVVPLNLEGDSVDLQIDWGFTDRVVTSVEHGDKPRSKDENFVFRPEDFEDAVVMPSYRNIDQPQYFYVAEIRHDLNPLSAFPSPELYKTFSEYYASKYGLVISNDEQPLLDVDHTSARLNLLIPRYMNQKGVPLPTSSAETKKARRENLQQKQILVPELCDVHVFLASLWRKAVCLPAILYRLNYLLLSEEIRKYVASAAKIGVSKLPEGHRFPKLDFGVDTCPENLKPLLESEDRKPDKGEENSCEGVDENNGQKDKNDEGLSLELKTSLAGGEKVDHSEEIEVKIDERDGEDGKLSQGPEENCEVTRNTDNNVEKNHVSHDNSTVNTRELNDNDQSCSTETSRHKSESIKQYEDMNNTREEAKPCKFGNTDDEGDIKVTDTRKINNGPLKNKTKLVDNVNELANDFSEMNRIEDVAHMNGVCEEDMTSICTDKARTEKCSCNFDTANGPTERVKNGAQKIENCSAMKSDMIDTSASRMETNDTTRTDDVAVTYDVKTNGNVITNDDVTLIDDVKTNDNVTTSSEISIQPTCDTDMNKLEENGDIFSDVGEFMPKRKQQVPTVETPAVPLVCLDEDTELDSFIGPSPCEILKALTMSNANDFFSLERMETIGDSFLKYAITVYLYCSYNGIHEGKLSYLRSRQVSNFNLHRLGKRKGLAECIISTKFEPYENWLPPCYVINEEKRKGPVPKVNVDPMSVLRSSSSVFKPLRSNKETKQNQSASVHMDTDKNDRSKGFQSELDKADAITWAKIVEEESAKKQELERNLTPYNLQLHHCLPDKSIADCVEALIGCYLTSCDKMAALRFMSWIGLTVLPKTTQSHRELSASELRALLCPASPIEHRSPQTDRVLEELLDGYEEFERSIGYTFRDRAYLLQAFTHASYHHNTVTDCYQRIEFLGDAVLDYVITRHLYEYSDKYSPGVLTDLRSALVNNNIFAALAVKWNFHKYFKALSPPLYGVIEKFVLRQKQKEDEIDDEEEEGDDDQDKEHVELEVPKALGDIFESVAGAVYLDSGMSLDAVWRVFYTIMKPQIDKYLENIPKSPVRELLEQEPETAKFEKPERTMDGKIRVTVNVVGKGVFTGVGRNYRIAKSAAARKALICIRNLEQKGLI